MKLGPRIPEPLRSVHTASIIFPRTTKNQCGHRRTIHSHLKDSHVAILHKARYRVESIDAAALQGGGATADVGGVVRLPSKFNSWIDAKALVDDRRIRRRRSGRNYQHDMSPWNIFGTACPKAEIVFLCQIVVLYTVIVVSRHNVKALS